MAEGDYQIPTRTGDLLGIAAGTAAGSDSRDNAVKKYEKKWGDGKQHQNETALPSQSSNEGWTLKGAWQAIGQAVEHGWEVFADYTVPDRVEEWLANKKDAGLENEPKTQISADSAPRNDHTP